MSVSLLEEWNVYRLKDGTRDEVKLIISVVQRVKGYSTSSEIQCTFLAPPKSFPAPKR